jgi:hypothetical protein
MKEFLCSLIGVFCVSGEPVDMGPVDPDTGLLTTIVIEKTSDHALCVETLKFYLPIKEEDMEEGWRVEEILEFIDKRCDELYPSQVSLEKRFSDIATSFTLPAMADMMPSELAEQMESEHPGLLESIQELQQKHVDKSLSWMFDELLNKLGHQKMVEYVEIMESPLMSEVMEATAELMPKFMTSMMEDFMPELMALLIEYE